MKGKVKYMLLQKEEINIVIESNMCENWKCNIIKSWNNNKMKFNNNTTYLFHQLKFYQVFMVLL